MSCLSFPFTESLEHKLYDLRVRSAKVAPPSNDIRLVAIDASSIDAIGRWPWPRSVVADLLSRIAAGEPRALGCAIIFSEPDENHGLTALRDLKDEYSTILETEEGALRPLLLRLAKDPRYKKDVIDHPFGDLRGFGQTLEEAARDLDSDARLTEAFAKAKGVLLSFYFRSLGRAGGEEPPEVVDRLKNMGLLQAQVEESDLGKLPEGAMPLLPLLEFSKRVEGLGHATVVQDEDGSVRRDAPVMMCRGQYVPSLALQMARVGMGLKMKDIRVRPGREIVWENERSPSIASPRC
jgi:CHASE2 domain-containing sensor protein